MPQLAIRILVVGGVANLVLSFLLGWVLGDQFAERSTGWVLATINAVLNTAGLAVVAVGVVRGVI